MNLEVMTILDDIQQTMRNESRRLRGLDDDLDGGSTAGYRIFTKP